MGKRTKKLGSINEQSAAMRDQFEWPDWVPAYVQEEVRGVWENPGQWLADAREHHAPTFGQMVAATFDHKLSADDGKQYFAGRYVHLDGVNGYIIEKNGNAADVTVPADPLAGAREMVERGQAAQAEIDGLGAGKPAIAEQLRLEVIRPGAIQFSADNTRENVEKHPDWAEFAQNVKLNGVRVPVHVRANVDGPPEFPWILVAGERRVRAAQAAGLATVPAVIHETMTADDAIELTILENYGREDLAPMEQSRGVTKMLERRNGDVRAVAALFGKSEKWVHMRVQLQKLTAAWQEAIPEVFANWSISHLELIARLPADTQDGLVAELGGTWRHDEWSTEELDNWLANKLTMLSRAPWNLAAVDVGEPGVPSCRCCEKRSGFKPLLFHPEGATQTEIEKNDRCLDPKCWKAKMTSYLVRRFAEVKAEHPEVVTVRQEYYGPPKEFRKRFGKPLAPYAYTKVKKDSLKAVPAFVVDGNDRGKTIWIDGKELEREKGKARGPSPQQQKSEREGRRMMIVGKIMAKQIPKVKVGDRGIELMLQVWLALRDYGNLASGLARFGKLKGKALLSAAWQQICKDMEDRMEYCRDPKSIEAVGKLFALDLRELREQALREVPEPEKGKKEKGKKQKGKRGVCRVCGCTDSNPCTDGNGQACHWVKPDLCSSCATGDVC